MKCLLWRDPAFLPLSGSNLYLESVFALPVGYVTGRSLVQLASAVSSACAFCPITSPGLPHGSVASLLSCSVTHPFLRDGMQSSLTHLVRAREGKERGSAGRALDCKTSGTCISSLNVQLSRQAWGTKKTRSYRTRSQTQCPSVASHDTFYRTEVTRLYPKGAHTSFSVSAAPSLHGPVHSGVEFGDNVRSGDGSHGNVISHNHALLCWVPLPPSFTLAVIFLSLINAKHLHFIKHFSH